MNGNNVDRIQVHNDFYKIIVERVDRKCDLSIWGWTSNNWVKVLSLAPVVVENSVINATKITNVSILEREYEIYLEYDQPHADSLVKTKISGNKSTLWIHFETTVILKKPVKLSKKGLETCFNLFPPPNQDEMVSINQPTKHTPPTEEWKSNDMPAGYVWNSRSLFEALIFVNLSVMSWMSTSNIPRFSHYECGFKRENRFGFLFSFPFQEPTVLPEGMKLNFDFYISLHYREQYPSKWNAVERLITQSFNLLPNHVPWPEKADSWFKMAENCVNDLMKENYCWIDREAPKYHAYVKDGSELQRRTGWKRKNVFETMTMLDILPPWLLYLQLHDLEDQKQHVERSTRAVHQFIDPESRFLYNNVRITEDNQVVQLKPSEITIGDSWYFFEPIIRFGWLALLHFKFHSDKAYLSSFETMCDEAIDFIKLHDYKVTAFYDPTSLKPLGDILEADFKRKQVLIESRGEKDVAWKMIAKNYSCLGMFIYIMVQAYELLGNKHYLENAEKAAKNFQNFSPDELFWEPLEIAYAVVGLVELDRLTNKSEYGLFGSKLALNLLRMFYWYDDTSFNWKGKRNTLGLVQACIGIRYPAMKENVESLYPLLPLLRNGMVEISKGFLKFFNLVRINSFWYFSDILPDEFIYEPRRSSPCKNIPFEDLEMLETPPHFSETQDFSPKGTRTGVLGREIYGAGEVIILYLMFEALAKCNDRNIMVLNLDLFSLSKRGHYPPKKQLFIIYNPLIENLTCKIELLKLPSRESLVEVKTLDRKTLIQKQVISSTNDRGELMLNIPAEEGLFLEISINK
ncbi:MAG: hypothetical protein ACXADA_17035 [Candidatus Hodarchaeales archaeon]